MTGSAMRAAVPSTPIKPSYKTGEFYQAIAPLLIAFIGLVFHRQIGMDAAVELLAGFGSVAAAAYAVYRQLLKIAHIKATAQVAAASAAATHTTVHNNIVGELTPAQTTALTKSVTAALERKPRARSR